jgi:hypothetical protein
MKEENDVRDRVMKKVFQKNEKNTKDVEKRSRFVFDKEKAKIVKKIKKIEEIEKNCLVVSTKKSLE